MLELETIFLLVYIGASRLLQRKNGTKALIEEMLMNNQISFLRLHKTNERMKKIPKARKKEFMRIAKETKNIGENQN